MAYDLALEFYLPVPPHKVMRMLTEPELIKAWSENAAIFENRQGGKIELFDSWVSGEVIKTGTDELEYSWTVIEWDEEVPPSIVSYKLIQENGATKIELKHTGLPNEEEMNKHESGWMEYFFGPMENYILENDF
jgi:activator of HSP90 ATPase